MTATFQHPASTFLAGSEPALPRGGARVLEVVQVWGDVMLESRRYRGKPTITLGDESAWRWRLLNRDIGRISGLAGRVLPYLPGLGLLGSEVRSCWAADFYCSEDSLPRQARSHALVQGGMLRVWEAWSGFVEIGGRRLRFGEAVAAGRARKAGELFEVPLGDGVRAVVDTGGMSYVVQTVAPGRRVFGGVFDSLDFAFAAILSALAFTGCMGALLLFFLPSPPRSHAVPVPETYLAMVARSPETAVKTPAADAAEGAKARRPEGKVGRREARQKTARGDRARTDRLERDREIAESAGVVGAMEDEALARMLGGSALPSDVRGGIGGLIGARGTQIGSRGLGQRGDGLGGDGTAEGLGGLGTKGLSAGDDSWGEEGSELGPKAEGGVVDHRAPVILGPLDRALVDEVVRRHMSQIRYCYQRELTKDPSLSGKIVVRFSIARDGTVSSSAVKSTTMGNEAVESCVTGRFQRMRFPALKGGEIVIVSYPFLFSPG